MIVNVTFQPMQACFNFVNTRVSMLPFIGKLKTSRCKTHLGLPIQAIHRSLTQVQIFSTGDDFSATSQSQRLLIH